MRVFRGKSPQKTEHKLREAPSPPPPSPRLSFDPPLRPLSASALLAVAARSAQPLPAPLASCRSRKAFPAAPRCSPDPGRAATPSEPPRPRRLSGRLTGPRSSTRPALLRWRFGRAPGRLPAGGGAGWNRLELAAGGRPGAAVPGRLRHGCLAAHRQPALPAKPRSSRPSFQQGWSPVLGETNAVAGVPVPF